MADGLRMADICTAIVDCVNRTAPDDELGDFFAVGTSAMRGNTIDFSAARRISADTFARWTRRLTPRPGDLLLAREAPVGPVVRIPSGGRVAPGQRTTMLRANQAVADPRFLYYYLIWPETQARLMALSMGSTVPHLRVADVHNFPIVHLPTLRTQAAISAVLGALDDKIAINVRIATVAEDLLRGHFDSLRMFKDDTSSLSTLRDFLIVNARRSISFRGEVRLVDMQKVPTRGWSIAEWDWGPARGGARFVNGDTLLARITPCLENRKTGYVDFLRPDEVAIGSTEFITLAARHGIPSQLSYFVATDETFRAFAMQHMVGTSGRQRVSGRDLDACPMAAPDPRALAAFGELAAPAFARVRAAADENIRLAQLREALLPQLMSGAIRVKDAEDVISEVV